MSKYSRFNPGNAALDFKSPTSASFVTPARHTPSISEATSRGPDFETSAAESPSGLTARGFAPSFAPNVPAEYLPSPADAPWRKQQPGQSLKDYHRDYTNRWSQERRRAWLAANGPCGMCGSWKDLEVDHREPSEKSSHRIWTYSAAKREAELAKCWPLCGSCHKQKSRLQKYPLTLDQVGEVLVRLQAGETQVALGKRFAVSRHLIADIAKGDHPYALPPVASGGAA